MLTSRISISLSDNPEPEDIFSSSLPALFTDDTQSSHGTPGGKLIYKSPTYGGITLHIPAHPEVEDGRKLFAHYLWNAAVVVAAGIEQGSKDGALRLGDKGSAWWDAQWWDVRGKRIMELGAGTALPSIICALCSASDVIITDHPSSPAVTTATIQANVSSNALAMSRTTPRTGTTCVKPYVWGVTTSSGVVGDDWVGALNRKVDKIIVADCLWMPSQHSNLANSISHFLAAHTGCCAIVVAGFHTGRAVVASFFDVATGIHHSGVGASALRVAEIYEIDVDGRTRPWQKVRYREGKEEAKASCVVAILVRSDQI